MNKLSRYIIIGTVTAGILFLAWYFSDILTCILISAVLALIGKPAMGLLTSLRIGKLKISPAIASLITLIILGAIVTGLIMFIIPLIGRIVTEMSTINLDEINRKLASPLYMYNVKMHEMFPTMDKDITIETMLMDQVRSIFSFDLFTGAFSSVTSFLVHSFVSAFTIVFVTFFFLKDNNTFTEMVLLFVPEKYEMNTRRAIESVNSLLIRYFTGISVEILCIAVLNTIGLNLIGGVNFQMAVVLAFLSGVLNVIPYIGPLVAGIFGTLMGVISLYSTGTDIVFGTMVITLAAIFVATHLIDVFIFQPYIYSNSVKAHPLEIFLVILIAGNVGGIIGMLIAIPAYTVIRVFAREFFSQFRLVQKLTDRMEITEGED
ncbi:MAG: AI-2E family transporter [Bacteroidales bacterium]|nr:AI-2E family transporter [Bacteroidales bacterium]